MIVIRLKTLFILSPLIISGVFVVCVVIFLVKKLFF